MDFGNYEEALDNALESCDKDLIYLVLHRAHQKYVLDNSENDKFIKLLGKSKLARNIYLN